MGHITMHFGVVAETAEQLQRRADVADELLSTLRYQVRETMSIWQGAAADGFRATYRSWDEAANDLHRRLREIRDIAANAHDNHAAAVTTNTSFWQV